MVSSVKAVSVTRSFHFPLPRHNRTPFVQIDTALCVACGGCVAGCPLQVLGLVNFLHHCHVHVEEASRCKGCGKCIRTCQQGAIKRIQV